MIEGDAQLRRGAMVIHADRLEYSQPDDLAKASGNVRINRAGDIFEGPLLELKVEAFEGFFSQPHYRFLRNDAYGEAERVDFIDDKRSDREQGDLHHLPAQAGPELDARLDPAREQHHGSTPRKRWARPRALC